MSGTSRSPAAPPRNRRNRWIRVVAAAVVFVSLTTTGPMALAQNQTRDQLRGEKEQVEEEQAETQQEIDELFDDLDNLEIAVHALVEARDSAEAAANAAIRKHEEAQDDLERAEARIAQLEAEVAETQQLLQESAVNAFTAFQGPNSEQTALSSDPWQHARIQSLRRFTNRSTEDLLDDYRGQSAELEALRADALRNVNELEDLRNEALDRIGKLRTAVANEERAVAKIEDRVGDLFTELEALENRGAELEDQIAREVARLEAIAAAARARARGVTVPPNAPVDLVEVQGIVVNVLIAEGLDGLLDAMRAEGFDLFGSGYRTNSRQIELRMEHCGTSDYAVYQMPSSQCSPPTARPGFSMHEVGLAVDFIYNGRLIRSRNTAVFQALARIAPDYGLNNLPSEPWHWSTTGQ